MKILEMEGVDVAGSTQVGELRSTPNEGLPFAVNLRHYLRNRFSSIADVDDIIQEAHLRLFRARKYQVIRCDRSFLFITARNLALSLMRRRVASPFVDIGPDFEADAPCWAPPIPETVHRKHLFELIAEAVDALPPRCRTAVKLCRYKGLAQRDVARLMGVSLSTVENQIAQGSRRCADYLRAKGVLREISR